MRSLSTCLVFFLALALPPSHAFAATQKDDEQWRACKTDAECTSIEVGCWHWAPVNVKYTEDMKAAHFIHCTKSEPPGPQPTSSCKAHLCVNDPYTVAYWQQLAVTDYPGGLVEKRLKGCLDKAGIEPPAAYGDDTPNHFMVFPYADMVSFFYQQVDVLIRKKTYSEDMPLDRIVSSAIACDDVVAKARSVAK